MGRRTFLVGSAMALPMMGANDKVNVAVVGVGGRGSAHVREYLGIPNAHIGALCDVNTAATERNEQVVVKSQADKPKIYQDLRKLYEDKDIEAVSIATPGTVRPERRDALRGSHRRTVPTDTRPRSARHGRGHRGSDSRSSPRDCHDEG